MLPVSKEKDLEGDSKETCYFFNMENMFTRTQLILGKDAMTKLFKSNVIVFGVGGVGSYVVEAIARSGVGAIDIVDNDKICLTNINRQIIATHKTLDKNKVDVAKERILEINPNCKVKTFKIFYLPENSDLINFSKYDYVIDAIDTITGKIEIIKQAEKHKVPVLSCMGTGNKLDPTKFIVSDIYKTSVCPLAKVMRKLCKDNKIESLKVVYSKEEPISPKEQSEEKTNKRQIPGSVAFVPSVAGLIIAGEVIKDLTYKG